MAKFGEQIQHTLPVTSHCLRLPVTATNIKTELDVPYLHVSNLNLNSSILEREKKKLIAYLKLCEKAISTHRKLPLVLSKKKIQ